MQTIATVIGRGHGGTRAAASWIQSAGFDLGKTNDSNDRHPFDRVYQAGRMALESVPQLGPEAWDVAALNTCPIPREWVQLWEEYFQTMGTGDRVVWKLPETLFSYPWLVRTFPEIRYLVWHRDPRTAILKKHGTDNLGRWNLKGWPEGMPLMRERALSWVVQYSLVEAVPPPPHHFRMTLSDFVHRQGQARPHVAALLGVEHLPQHAVKPSVTKHGKYGEALEPALDLIQPYFLDFDEGK